jgi:uncharacterized protein
MKRLVLLDTGPLVAFIDCRDQFHTWSATQWADIEPPFLTCESVLAEACYLLRSYPKACAAILEMVSSNLVQIPFRIAEDSHAIALLLKKYAQVPISLADACLVRMANAITGSTVLTLDTDFRLYRKANRTVIPLIMPDIGRSRK